MTSTITEMALALGASVELSILSKATVILLLGLTAARFAGRARASMRHLFLATTFAAVLALPLIAALAPGVRFEVPVSSASNAIATARAVSQSDVSDPSTTSAAERRAPEIDSSSTPSWPTIARSLWIAGALLMLVAPAVGLMRLRRIRREALPWPELRHLVQSLASECGIKRSVEVLLHEEIPAPVTFSAWRPAIILPSDACEWSEADLRRALVHELEHVRRGDWAVQLSARAICACYWFHPMVWVAWRRLRLEAERASDDAVVEVSESTEYAEQLVLLARRLSGAQSQTTLGMANRSDLSARVSNLLDGTQRRGRAGLLAAASALCVASLVVFTIAPVRAVAQSTKPTSVSTTESAAQVRDPRGRRREMAEEVKVPQIGESIAQGTIVRWLKHVGDTVKRDEPLFEISTDKAAAEIPSPTAGVISQILAKEGETVAVNSVVAVINDSASTDGALFEAAERGDTSAIEKLLLAGANVNCTLRGDGSPLIGAARAGRLAAVRLLLDRGADPNIPVSGDGSPLIVAAGEGHADVVALLLDRGADPNIAVHGDGSPLIMAAREGHIDIIALLLDRGAKIDQMVPDDENALIQASGEGHLNIVKLLVARGANVNARIWVEQASERPNGEWRTPLRMARKGGHNAVVVFLLEVGARED